MAEQTGVYGGELFQGEPQKRTGPFGFAQGMLSKAIAASMPLLSWREWLPVRQSEKIRLILKTNGLIKLILETNDLANLILKINELESKSREVLR